MYGEGFVINVWGGVCNQCNQKQALFHGSRLRLQERAMLAMLRLHMAVCRHCLDRHAWRLDRSSTVARRLITSLALNIQMFSSMKGVTDASF
jgi:hypothetical protein